MLFRFLLLSVFSLITLTAMAETCQILNVQTFDIDRSYYVTQDGQQVTSPTTSESNTKLFLVSQTERCATIHFSMSGRGSRLVSSFKKSLEATFADGRQQSAVSLQIHSDTGHYKTRIQFGQVYQGVACFGQNDLPIAHLACRLDL